MLIRKVTEIPPTQDRRPIELRHLRVAAYYQVSTELEEQTSSIELQERSEFRRMIAQCRKKRIDLLLTK